MAVQGRVAVLNEVKKAFPPKQGETWELCFQRCRYMYSDGHWDDGYRFIWRRPDGSLQGARGQARLPSLEEARLLMAAAEDAGWGHHETDAEGHFIN